ncbi:MAG: hypothetical protein JXA16_12740, partial [Bacteroidales bacterium]|nr:hypothetical protein [Bacteroidales bacterium]
NIALIKYWGKKEKQIPQNASVSFTLSESYTETEIVYSKKESNNKIEIKFLFEEKDNELFEKKIVKFLNYVLKYFPFLTKLNLTIKSKNSFPHSAGIASSASSMSALALCLCSIEKKHYDSLKTNDTFYRKASFIARLGSGSAARSVFPFAASWGKHADLYNSSNKFASILPFNLHENFKSYNDAILIISKKEKQVSSTAGHNLMKNHPFAKQRYKLANKKLQILLNALQNGDLDGFIEVVEDEALTLHSLMMSSNPGFILIEPNTLAVIEKIRNYRKINNSKLCFTLDAGPNIHLLYPDNEEDSVFEFIKNDLQNYCENRFWISDKIGKGPFEINKQNA